MLQAEMDPMREAMDEAPRLVDSSRGAKGFLPEMFVSLVSERFNGKVGQLGYLKLTAPAALVRRRTNAPDAWEEQIIRSRFQSPRWNKGEFVEQEAELNGGKAYRLLIPEYYEASCLACHGVPAGSKDITGAGSQGGKPGDLGGAINAAIYLK